MTMTRKSNTYHAVRSSFVAKGATRAEAKEKLAKLIDWACEHHAPVIETTCSRATIIVAATANGWKY